MSLLNLSRGVTIHRQACQVLHKWNPLLYGSVRWCSGEGRKDVIAKPQHQDEGPSGGDSLRRLTDHRVNRLEKYLLVWGGKYKTVADVPDLVRQDVLERARNKARIKINLMMVGATLLACLLMIYLGKKAQAAGETVVKMNQDWHQKINEEYRLSKEKQE